MPTPSRLMGLWRLVSYIEKMPDGRSIDVFGPGPKGYLNYSADGSMMVMAAAADRPRLRGPWDKISLADKAGNYDRIIAYAGRYTDMGDRVWHHVEVCWIPNWEGKDLERLVIPAGEGRIILRTPPDKPPSQDLLWERIG